MNRFLMCYGYLVLVTMATCKARTEETCSELELTGFRHGHTVKVSENSYVSVPFHLETSKCKKLPEWFRLKVSCHQGDFNVDVCSMIFITSPPSCDVTDHSAYCRCVSEAGLSALLYKQVIHSGNMSYLWSWSDSSSGQTQKKAQIMFDVTSTATTIKDEAARETAYTSVKLDSGKTDKLTSAVTVRAHAGVTSLADLCGRESLLTSPETNDKKGEGLDFQFIFINSIVTASVISIPIIIAICIYVYRQKRASLASVVSSQPNDDYAAASVSRPTADNG